MKDRELYQQKMQAQLDQWKAEVDKLKAKSSGSSADAQEVSSALGSSKSTSAPIGPQASPNH